LPDLGLCRDCLVHLSFENIGRAIDNIRVSGARYLLTTTFLDHEVNGDIEDGDWRMLNLEREPFNLPPPVDVLVEHCEEGDGAYADKALGLWELVGSGKCRGQTLLSRSVPLTASDPIRDDPNDRTHLARSRPCGQG